MSDPNLDAWDRHADNVEAGATMAHLARLNDIRLRLTAIARNEEKLSFEKVDLYREIVTLLGVKLGDVVPVGFHGTATGKVMWIQGAGIDLHPRDVLAKPQRYLAFVDVLVAPETKGGYHATKTVKHRIWDDRDEHAILPSAFEPQPIPCSECRGDGCTGADNATCASCGGKGVQSTLPREDDSVEAARYRRLCALIDAGGEGLACLRRILDDAENMGAGALDLHLDEVAIAGEPEARKH